MHAMSTDKNHSQNGKSDDSNREAAPSFTDKHQDAGKQDVATAADWDDTVRQVEAEVGERKPSQSQGNKSNQDNNGRGGGK